MNANQSIKIRKATQILGKSLLFRNVNIDDAEFILSLRTDAEKSRYLSAVSANLVDQMVWLENYAQIENQAYFIIEHEEKAIGTVRLYDSRGDSFCWGSWILKNDCANHAALESALMVYAYAIDHLGFQSAHFDVRLGNERVWKFHERFGAKRVASSAENHQYEISLEDIAASRKRYHRFLSNTVTVEYL